MDRRWQLKFWALIGAFIGLAIGLAVVLATSLQAARSLEAWNQEYVTWHATQVEVEFWRMLECRDAVRLRRRRCRSAGTRPPRRHHVQPGLGFRRRRRFATASTRSRAPPPSSQNLKAALVEQEPLLRSLSPGDFNTLVADSRQARADRAAPPQPRGQVRVLRDDRRRHRRPRASRPVPPRHRPRRRADPHRRCADRASSPVEIRVRRRLLESVLASREQARAAREREEAALLESGRRFRAIAMANPVALLVLDAARRRDPLCQSGGDRASRPSRRAIRSCAGRATSSSIPQSSIAWSKPASRGAARPLRRTPPSGRRQRGPGDALRPAARI